ncbi:hypothetical protein GQ53DRAFT_753675 [Thozetella sp. PMI_491]|nr:hypothetical protein GQ53DRAFT_753675 [Thozetella sp. PMI_491]
MPISGPPFPSQMAGLGLLPSPNPDAIICGVLLVFFVASAATNMTILQVNLRRDHKFLFSGLLFGFSMARISALTMRIVWSTRQTNVSVAIAANIFVGAGVLLLFIVNLLFAQRIVRALHPQFGWNKTVTYVFRFLLFCVVAMLIMVVTTTVHSFYTLDAHTHDIERKIQLFVGTYLAVLSFLPIPIVIVAQLWPRAARVEKFGTGSWRTKIRLVLFTSTLLSFGATYRVAVNYMPRPVSDPAWYHSKAAFYCVNFVIELIVVFTYVITRFDRRFHIPNGSSGPGDYLGRINKESDVFGSDSGEDLDESSGSQAELGQAGEKEKEVV